MSGWKLGPALAAGNADGAEAVRNMTSFSARSMWPSSPVRRALPAGIVNVGARRRSDDRHGAHRSSRRRQGQLHRLDRRRLGHHGERRPHRRQADDARAWRQVPAARLRRRRSRRSRPTAIAGSISSTPARPASPARASSSRASVADRPSPTPSARMAAVRPADLGRGDEYSPIISDGTSGASSASCEAAVTEGAEVRTAAAGWTAPATSTSRR